MKIDDYPLFVPPVGLACKSHREWTRSESQAYFEWLMESLDGRVKSLLRALVIPEDLENEKRLLLLAGERIVEALDDPRSTVESSEGGRTLSNLGYSLAADIGLLTGKLVKRTLGDRVRWEVVRKPKSDMSYNLPVLAGFKVGTYDPVGVSIADASSVLAGRRTYEAWCNVYEACVGKFGL